MLRRGLVIVIALVLFVFGCGARGRNVSFYEAPIGSDDVEAGHRRYRVVCAPCHEHRDERGAPSLSALGFSPARVRRQVREGSALMPPIRPNRLSDAELEDLLAYFADIGAVIEESSADEEAVTWEPAPRSEHDAGLDAPIDAGIDAPLDAGHDGGMSFVDPWIAIDAAIDAPVTDAPIIDAPIDAPITDAPVDAPMDALAEPDAGVPSRGRTLADPHR